MIIPFEKTNGVYTLQDTLVLDDNYTFTDEEIETLKQQLFDNWVAIQASSANIPQTE